MSTNRVRKFTEVFELETFLNGGLILGQIGGAAGSPASLLNGIYGLVGKTLKFTSPSGVTVTFAASSGTGGSADPAKAVDARNPDPSVLVLADIKAQIEAAIATVRVSSYKGRLVLIEVTPTSGIALDKTGTANALLGVDAAVNTVGKIYAPPPSATPPCWTWHSIDGSNSHTILTLE